MTKAAKRIARAPSRMTRAPELVAFGLSPLAPKTASTTGARGRGGGVGGIGGVGGGGGDDAFGAVRLAAAGRRAPPLAATEKAVLPWRSRARRRPRSSWSA